jgi:hypothetical protein
VPKARFWSALVGALERESDRWFLWVPVFVGVGIGAYFSLSNEPWPLIAPSALALSLCAALFARRHAAVWAAVMACLFAATGFASADLRTHLDRRKPGKLQPGTMASRRMATTGRRQKRWRQRAFGVTSLPAWQRLSASPSHSLCTPLPWQKYPRAPISWCHACLSTASVPRRAARIEVSISGARAPTRFISRAN